MRVWWTLLLCLLAATSAWGRSYPSTPDAELAAQERWGAWMQGYVVSGCLPARSPTLTLTLPPCVAWVKSGGEYARLQGLSEETPRTVALPAGDQSYWLGVRASPGGVPAGWTCWPGLHYCYRALAGNPPTPDGVTVVARLTIESGAVTRAGDVRPDSPIPGGPANLRSPLYGAVGDCVADDTVAVQTWVNNTAWRQQAAYAPRGCYLIRQIWLNHDAVNNPNYPEDLAFQGNYTLSGDGPMQVNSMTALPSRQPGTIFKSTATTGPAFTAFSAMGGGNPNALRGLRLEGLSVVQTSTSPVVLVDGANTLSWLKQVFIAQQGTGDGLVWKNTFLTRLEDLMVYTDLATNAGIGVQVYNTTGVGGIVHLTNVTGRGFGIAGVRLGTEAQAGTRLAGVQAIGVQGLFTPVGIQFWGAMTGAICSGCYTEATTTTGVEIAENALGVSILGGWFDASEHADATDAAIRIGGRASLPGGTAFDSRAQGVVIQGARIDNVEHGAAIWREWSDEVGGTIIQGNRIGGTSTGLGIVCAPPPVGADQQHNLVILGNHFSPELAAPVGDTCRAYGELIQTHYGVWIGRRVNLGQGGAIASAATITIPTNGNVFNLTGSATVQTISCAQCTTGSMLWFYVQVGNAPVLTEGGNLLLADSASNTWTGAGGAVIALLWEGTAWRELYRVKD